MPDPWPVQLLVIATRYIARGLDNMQLYVLSVVGIALFLGLRFAMGRMNR